MKRLLVVIGAIAATVGMQRLVAAAAAAKEASAEYGIADPMHWELISKMPWAGLGTPRKHPKFRHMDGSVFNARLYINDRLVVDRHGMLDRALLYHLEVLEAAAEFDDPYTVLAPVSHDGHGSGTLW